MGPHPKWKKTSLPKWKITKMYNDHIGRQPKWKTTNYFRHIRLLAFVNNTMVVPIIRLYPTKGFHTQLHPLNFYKQNGCDISPLCEIFLLQNTLFNALRFL